MKEPFKDTDLREALKRKYADTPQLPADFMAKMAQQTMPKPAATIRHWRWIAAAACLLVLIGLGITMLHKDHTGQGKNIYAQADNPRPTDNETEQIGQEQQEVLGERANMHQEAIPHPTKTVKANKPVAEEVHVSTETTPMTEVSATYHPAKDDNLHYASQSLTADTAYQAPSRMNEFIAKIADYNQVKAVALDCTSDNGNHDITNTAYIFQDTHELDLFARLMQAACSYDSKTPGYLLNFSHQQFFFTLKDLRKGEKYLWIAERINGERILLYTTRSPIEAEVSSACFQEYREQLTHTNLSSFHF